MTVGLKACGLLLMAMTVIGCGEMAGAERKETSSPNPVLSMLNKGILQLTLNIQGLTKRIAELRQFPDTTDPALRELRALDLSGWELHQQQWLLQRDHLQFAYGLLQRAKATQAEKPQFLEEWSSMNRSSRRSWATFGNSGMPWNRSTCNWRRRASSGSCDERKRWNP